MWKSEQMQRYMYVTQACFYFEIQASQIKLTRENLTLNKYSTDFSNKLHVRRTISYHTWIYMYNWRKWRRHAPCNLYIKQCKVEKGREGGCDFRRRTDTFSLVLHISIEPLAKPFCFAALHWVTSHIANWQPIHTIV